MKFKSYAGKDLAEIVPKIREELGPDAVILKQRQTQSGGVGGFFSRRGVEVLAADRAPADAVGTPGGGAVAAPPAPARPAARRGASDGGPSAEALLAETFAAALNEHVARTGGETAPAPAAEEEDAMPAARMLTSAARRRSPTRRRLRRPRAAPTPSGSTPCPQPERGLHIAPLPVFARGDELDEEGSDLMLELERAGVSSEIARRLVDEVVLHVQPFASGRCASWPATASPRASARSRAGRRTAARAASPSSARRASARRPPSCGSPPRGPRPASPSAWSWSRRSCPRTRIR